MKRKVFSGYGVFSLILCDFLQVCRADTEMHTDSITERTFQLPSIPPPRRVTLAPSCMQSTNRQTASGPLMADLTSSFYRPEISDPNMCPEHKQTDNDSSSHSRLLPPPPTGLRSALFHPWRVNMTPNHSSPLGVSDSLCSSSPHNKTFSTFSYSTHCSSFILFVHSFLQSLIHSNFPQNSTCQAAFKSEPFCLIYFII